MRTTYCLIINLPNHGYGQYIYIHKLLKNAVSIAKATGWTSLYGNFDYDNDFVIEVATPVEGYRSFAIEFYAKPDIAIMTAIEKGIEKHCKFYSTTDYKVSWSERKTIITDEIFRGPDPP